MESNNKILSNQLVVMSRSDLDTMVNEMAQNIVAAQTKNAQSDYEAWMYVPEEERFLTRKETARLLHVNYTTLWRWNKQGYLRSRKIGGKAVLYISVQAYHSIQICSPDRGTLNYKTL